MLAIVAYHDYEIWQMDVKTAFLNGFIEESTYMQQPVGFTCDAEKNKVCKLHRSIYGLKQASRSLSRIRMNPVYTNELKIIPLHFSYCM